MDNERTLFDRLNTIESNQEQKGKSISAQIGESFDRYLDQSTIYYFEPDERKFLRDNKKQSTRLLIISIIYLTSLIWHVIMSIHFNYITIWNYIADILFVLSPVFYYIYAKKQKNKKIANSRWNIHNHVFYKYANKLGEEDNTGLIGKVLLGYKIISFILFIASTLLFILFGDFDEVFQQWAIVSQIIFLIPFNFLHVLGVKYNEYYYPEYIFEMDDSYVIQSYDKWEKFMK